MQQARDHQPVALLVTDLGGDHLGRALRGKRVQPEALGHGLPDAGAFEEVERAKPAREVLDGVRAERLDGGDGTVDRAPDRGARFARRRTEISSATSDSTVATTGPIGGCSCPASEMQPVAGTRRAPGTPRSLQRLSSDGGRVPRAHPGS